MTLQYTYFEEPDPFVADDTATYTDQSRPLAHARSYQWNHSLGEIVTALIENGLRMVELTEHDWTVWEPDGEGLGCSTATATDTALGLSTPGVPRAAASPSPCWPSAPMRQANQADPTPAPPTAVPRLSHRLGRSG